MLHAFYAIYIPLRIRLIAAHILSKEEIFF